MGNHSPIGGVIAPTGGRTKLGPSANCGVLNVGSALVPRGCDFVAQHGADHCMSTLTPFADALENSMKFQSLQGQVSIFQLPVRKTRAEAARERSVQ